MLTVRGPGAPSGEAVPRPTGEPSPDLPTGAVVPSASPSPALPSAPGGSGTSGTAVPPSDVDPSVWAQPAALVAVVLTVLVLLAGAFLLGRAQRARGAPDADRPELRPEPAPARDHPSGIDSAALAAGLVALHDSATDDVDRLRVERVLRQGGVEPIRAGPGDAFDDRWHHAVARSPSRPGAGAAAPVTVAAVVRPGWRAGDWVVRPAEVAVHAPAGGAS